MKITKTFLLHQFTYIASLLDPSYKTFETINHLIQNFVDTGTTKPSTRNYWIHQDILYRPKNEGDLNFIDIRSLFYPRKFPDIIDKISELNRAPGTKYFTGVQKPYLTWYTQVYLV